jgi:hypothetical protein
LSFIAFVDRCSQGSTNPQWCERGRSGLCGYIE